ncbi:salivary peroxidase/catechol oxidase-like isoform X2 [Littorina saxatilis]
MVAAQLVLAVVQLLTLTGLTSGQVFRANGAQVNFIRRPPSSQRVQMLVLQIQQTTTVTYIASPMTSAFSQFIINNPRGLIFASQRANQRMQDLALQNVRFKRIGLDGKRSESTPGRHTMFIGTKPASMALQDDKNLIDFLLEEIFRAMGFTRDQAAAAMRDIIVYNKQGNAVNPSAPVFATVTPAPPPSGPQGNNPLTCQDSVQTRCDRFARFRTPDGTCNNLQHDLWGSSFIPMRRFMAPEYGDGISAPRSRSVFGQDLPSARLISVGMHPSGPDGENSQLTHMLMQWGQFLDHDITSTPIQTAADGSALTCCEDEQPAGSRGFVDVSNRTACFPIPILPNDPFFVGRRCFSFPRSVQVTNANCQQSPVEQLNQISAYIDASMVYGSTEEEQRQLREFRGGRLKISGNDLLPKDDEETCVLNNPARDYCFKAGDTRVNEQMGLSSMHTVWMRQHNRLVKQLSQINPQWGDERLFQVARKIVGALIQRITYGDFLPIILDRGRMNRFGLDLLRRGMSNSYNPNVDASVRNVFATAAYRFGHSLIRTTLSQLTHNYESQGWWRLEQSFGNTSQILESRGIGVDMYMRGFLRDPPNAVDRFFTGEIQNHLFQDGTGNSVDLIAFNIQRGRDHGLPAYNSWRRFCGLRAASSFNNMPDHDRFTSQRFSQVYRHVDDIDVFSGGISERAEGGGLVGPLFACILSQQFSNLKFGDRFWFETSDQNTGFTPDQLDQIRKHSLPRVLCDVTAITRIQPNPFRQVSLGNPLMNCQDVPEMNLMLWQEGGRGFLSTALWGEWSNWSQCKDGVQSRVRSCSQGGRQGVCGGPGQDTRGCNDLGWTVQWSQWSMWFECQQGFQRRTRVCQGLGNPCPGSPEDIRICRGGQGRNTRNLARGTRGAFSNLPPPGWAEWAPWSRDCQQGKQWRRRTCNSDGGGGCVGPSSASRPCGNANDNSNRGRRSESDNGFNLCDYFSMPALC